MGNEGIYSVGKDLVKQKHNFLPNRMFREYLAKWPLPRDICENLQAGITLHLSVKCFTRGSFTGKLLARHSRNPLVHRFKLKSSHSLTLIPYN